MLLARGAVYNLASILHAAGWLLHEHMGGGCLAPPPGMLMRRAIASGASGRLQHHHSDSPTSISASCPHASRAQACCEQCSHRTALQQPPCSSQHTAPPWPPGPPTHATKRPRQQHPTPRCPRCLQQPQHRQPLPQPLARAPAAVQPPGRLLPVPGRPLWQVAGHTCPGVPGLLACGRTA